MPTFLDRQVSALRPADGDNLAEAVSVLADEYELPAETWAQLLADTGRTYCESGRLAIGRPYLRRALRLDPTRYHAVAASGFSLLGSPRAFDAAMGTVYTAEQRLGPSD